MGKINEQAVVDVYVNGEKTLSSIKQMEKAMKELRAAARSTDDPKTRQQAIDQYRVLSKQVDEHNQKLRGTHTLWSRIRDEVKAFGLVAASYLGIQALTSQIQSILSANARLSDSLADIQRISGMTAKEVKEFDKQLRGLDTRTATKDLREMSATLAQMGFAKEDLLQTTEAMDKLNVAMGREFGGNAEQLAETLGKTRNVLYDMKTAQADQDLMHLGNAILTLGQSGLATGPVMADFANRIGGVGIPLGLTSAQVLGLSATLQELNVSTERGGTAVGKILQKMITNTAEFAKVADMEVGAFTEMVNTDLFGAFQKVIEGSQKAGTSSVALGNILKDAELQGSGASEVFLKLAVNMGLLGEKVQLTGESLNKTDEITKAFALKNQTLGAEVDKLGKRFASFVSSSSFNNFLAAGVGVVNKFLDVLSAIPGVIQRNISAVVALSGIMLTYYSRVIAATVATTANTVAKGLNTAAFHLHYRALLLAEGASKAYALTTQLLTGQIKLATFAQRVWNGVIAANPVGFIIAGLAALVTAINVYTRNTKEAISLEKQKKDVAMELLRVNQDAETVQNKFNESVSAFNKLSPQQQQNIYDEIRAKKQSTQATLENIQAKIKEIELESNKPSFWQKAANSLLAYGNTAAFAHMNAQDGAENAQEATAEYADQIQKLKDQIAGLDKVQSAAEERLNAEANAMKMVTVTTDQYQEKLRLLRIALNNAVIGSEDYKRIGREIQATQQALAGGTETKTAVLNDQESLLEELARLQIEAIEDEKQREKEMLIWQHGQDVTDIREREATQEAKNNLILAKKEELIRKLAELDTKMAKELSEKELAQDLKNLETWHAQQKLKISQQRAENVISEEDYQTQLNDLQLKYLALKVINLRDYGKETTEVEQQLADLSIKIAKDKNHQIQEDFKAAMKGMSREQKEEFAMLTAALTLLMATGVSITGESAAEMLEKIKKLLAGAGKNAESAIQEWAEKAGVWVNRIGGALSDVWGGILASQNASTDKWLSNQRRAYDAERLRFKQLLDRKVIDQRQYDAKMAELDEKQDKAQRKAQRDQALRGQRLAIFQASISAALAALKTLAEMGWPLAAPFMAAAAITAGLQISAIKKQELPELRRGKLFTGGGKHPYSRMTVVESSGDASYVEDGEVLLSAATVSENPEMVGALLDASQNNEGRIREPFVRALEREIPEINAGRVSETTRILRQEDYGGGALNGRVVTNVADPMDHPVFRKMVEVVDRLGSTLEGGVQARLEYRPFKRDLKRLDRLTGEGT